MKGADERKEEQNDRKAIFIKNKKMNSIWETLYHGLCLEDFTFFLFFLKDELFQKRFIDDILSFFPQVHGLILKSSKLFDYFKFFYLLKMIKWMHEFQGIKIYLWKWYSCMYRLYAYVQVVFEK